MHQSYRNHTTVAAPLRNPLSHLPLFRAASELLLWTDAETAQFCLTRDRNNLAAAEQNYAAACAALGAANRMNRPMRRFWQAKAFRDINARRQQLRRARAALAVSLVHPALTAAQLAA